MMGALSLYLNFINLFMLMLRLAGVHFALIVLKKSKIEQYRKSRES